jgi:hypothetical protein
MRPIASSFSKSPFNTLPLGICEEIVCKALSLFDLCAIQCRRSGDPISMSCVFQPAEDGGAREEFFRRLFAVSCAYLHRFFLRDGVRS